MSKWVQEMMSVKRNPTGTIIGVREPLEEKGPTETPLDTNDQYRRDQAVKTLTKAKWQMENALLYLTANNRELLQVADARLALEHIEIALERLGVAVDS